MIPIPAAGAGRTCSTFTPPATASPWTGPTTTNGEPAPNPTPRAPQPRLHLDRNDPGDCDHGHPPGAGGAQLPHHGAGVERGGAARRPVPVALADRPIHAGQ